MRNVKIVAAVSLFVFAMVGGVTTVFIGAEPPLGPQMRKDAQNLMNEGNFKEALDRFRKLCLDPAADRRLVCEDLAHATQCQLNLGRQNEFDGLIESVLKVHPNNWLLLKTVSDLYLAADHNGYMIAGNFVRGQHRGGDKPVQAWERDRILALQLTFRALPLAQKDENVKDVCEYYQSLANQLLANRGYVEAWRLQYLSDVSQLPDYDEGFYYGGEYHGAPVDVDGKPVFHYSVKKWEDAKTDGERWRWALDQIVERDASRLKGVRLQLAQFFQQQFDVTTLQNFGWGHYFFGSPADDDTKKNESGTYALHTLKDTETIAKLANGVKRFDLPDEFNFVKIYQSLNDDSQLAQIYENRRQYPRAADHWKKAITTQLKKDAAAIDKLLAAPAQPNDTWEVQRYKQIVAKWGHFEPTSLKVAGEGAKIDYRFRNGKKVQFEAFPIDEEKLIQDVKTYLKSDPQQIDWSKISVDQVGYRLVELNEKKYLGAKVADWSLELDPRENHWDRRVTVSTPLQKAGAYFVTAKMEGGNVSRIVLWVADTAIVKKPLKGNKALYFVADANSGQPVADANLEFFGYSQDVNNRWRVKTSQFAERSDANGLSMPDARDLKQDHHWFVIARTQAGRLAYLGFSNVWYGERYDEQYEAIKIFQITDRPVYRPNQKVQFKFWVRQTKYDQDDRPQFAKISLPVEIHNAKGDKVYSQSLTTDDYGGVAGSFDLPNDATLGVYQLSANLMRGNNPIASGNGSFRVEEYKKPEFEVTVDAPKAPVMLGEKITAKINAKYYFGSPVTKATVKYKVTRVNHSETWYPKAPWDWCFGPGYWWFGYDTPWYPRYQEWAGCLAPLPAWWHDGHSQPPEVVAEVEMPIGSDGELSVDVDTLLAKELHGNTDHQYTISAEVRDESRRTIVGTGNVLVARKPFKVYTWLDRGYYRVGETMRANFQAQTLDHKPVKGEGELTLLRIKYDEKRQPVETPVQTWKLNTGDEGSAAQQLKASEAGQYRLSFKVTDAKGHVIEGGYLFTIVGPGFDGREFRYNHLELIPDKQDYQPGETVKLQINTERPDSTVLLFVRPSNGVYLPPVVLRLKGKSTVHEIGVVKKDMPNFFVEAVTLSEAQVHAQSKEIVVPPEKRVLNVEVVPSEKEYKPGEEAKLKVRVTDFTGENYVGSLVVTMYDKSVEYISGGSNVADIKEFFWKWRRDHQPQNESSLTRGSQPIGKQNEVQMASLGVFGQDVAEEMDQLQTTSFATPSAGAPAKAMMLGGVGGMGGGMAWGATGRNRGVVLEAAAAMGDDAAKASNKDQDKAFRAEANVTGGAPAVVQPTVRSNFADTAYWSGSLETDKAGLAEIKLKMPENLTAWKIKVWGMGQGTRVGSGDAEVVTRKNLILRLQAPRFVVQKDEVVLSANVHNYLKTDKEVTVVLETSYDPTGTPTIRGGAKPADTASPLKSLAPLTQVITVPAGGEKRVDWRVKVEQEGAALVRMKALTDEESDATELKLPSYVHGMLKTEAWAGTVRPEKERSQVTINVPAERRVDQSVLEVRYSPTLAGAMVDALPYLADFPYGCTEQTLNRFLPSVITQKTLRELGVNLAEIRDKRTNLNAQEIGNDVDRAKQWKRPNREAVFDEVELNRMVKEGLNALTNMQCSDGGWGWFSGHGEHSWPHTTAVVVHGLQIAQQNDLPLVPGTLERGVEWLKRHQAAEVQKIKNAPSKKLPLKETADDLDAFVYMVLVDAGADNVEMRDFLYRDRVRLAVYSKAMFGLALHKQKDQEKLAMILQNINQFVVQDEENETAYLKLPETNYWWNWYGSEIEADAYYLKLLSRVMGQAPANPNPASNQAKLTAPRLVKYLLNNRKHGSYWTNTRDTANCVEAFADYLRASGEQKPDMFVEVWLDGEKRKETHVTGANLFTFDNKFVLNGADVKTGSHTLEIRRRGTGPVYFNAYLTNFTLEDNITRAGLEVKVNRKFYQLTSVDQKTKVAGSRGQALDQKVEKYERRLIENLSTLKSGDLVEVELEIDSKNDYEYVLFEDMKAAGFEPVDVRSGYAANGLGAYMELRDNRVSFFVRALARGKHSLAYRLRAEIPGQFSALPARASAMYAPELKGNSDELKVKIVD